MFNSTVGKERKRPSVISQGFVGSGVDPFGAGPAGRLPIQVSSYHQTSRPWRADVELDAGGIPGPVQRDQSSQSQHRGAGSHHSLVRRRGLCQGRGIYFKVNKIIFQSVHAHCSAIYLPPWCAYMQMSSSG